MAKQSPVQRIWELGKDQHGRLITAVILAVVGVVCGMVPYFAAAQIIALLLQKLPRLPLSTVMDTSRGKLKQIIVDQVDSMETTLAHLFPEMTANITAPVLTLI